MTELNVTFKTTDSMDRILALISNLDVVTDIHIIDVTGTWTEGVSDET